MTEARRLAIALAAAVGLLAGLAARPATAQAPPPKPDPFPEAPTTGEPPPPPAEPPASADPAASGGTFSLPPAAGKAARRDRDADAGRDPAVLPAQATGPAGGDSGGAESFFPKPEVLPVGPHAVGLTVNAEAPAAINLGKNANLWIVVRNSGTTDALGVVVREALPKGLEFVESKPPIAAKSPFLSWNLKTIRPGTEVRIQVVVKAVEKVGNIDHAPTVTMMTGGRARMAIREPKLRVEQRASASQALKGEKVRFDVTVTNTGDGPARDVAILAKLGAGLKFQDGNTVKLRLGDLEPPRPALAPGESVTLDPLFVEAVTDGDNACTVSAESPDVAPDAPESRAQDVIHVVAPKLVMTVKGPSKRYTDSPATYTLVLENDGSAPARRARAIAYIRPGARLLEQPEGATFNKAGQFLKWDLGDLEPKKSVEMPFTVRLEGVQIYAFKVGWAADDIPNEYKSKETHVSGMADVTLSVSEAKRVIDVGESTTFVIKIANRGTSEARNLLIKAQFTDHLDPENSSGTEKAAEVNKAERMVRFPQVEKLAPGATLTISIQAKAVGKAGQGACKVEVLHDDDAREDDSKTVRITENAAPAGN